MGQLPYPDLFIHARIQSTEIYTAYVVTQGQLYRVLPVENAYDDFFVEKVKQAEGFRFAGWIDKALDTYRKSQ